MLDPLYLGASTPAQFCARIDLGVLLLGLSRVGPVFSLSVLEFTHLDVSLVARSFARIGVVILVLDLFYLGPSMPSRFGARLGPTSLLMGTAWAGISLLVTEPVFLGSSLPLRSRSQSGPSLLATDLLHLGALMPLHSRVRLGSPAPSLGLARSDIVFSPPVTDYTHLGVSLSVRSMACSGVLLSVPDFLYSEPFSAPRAVARLGSFVVVLGSARIGFVFPCTLR